MVRRTAASSALRRLIAPPASAHVALGLIAVVYVATALNRPSDVFWSADQGGKMLQVLAFLEGRPDLSVTYPGRTLDPELIFRPYSFSYLLGATIRLPWLMSWALPSALLYATLGGAGLVLLPVAGGVLAAWSAGRLAERIAPGSGWLATLLTGLATPMFVFSTLFWEHAPAAGVFAWGLLLLPIEGRARLTIRSLLAGACFGLAVAWRTEACLYVAAAASAASVAARDSRQRRLAWLSGGLALVLIPAETYNWLITGAVGIRASTLPGSPARVMQTLLQYTPQLPADLLVGRRVLGQELPEPIRWAPAAGLALLAAAIRADLPGRRWLEMVGLILVGSATAWLLVSPAPLAVNGLLIAAPFLALSFLAPGLLSSTPTGKFLVVFGVTAPTLYAAAAPIMHVEGVAGGGAEWGPRYLLPVFPPLTVLATAALGGALSCRPVAEQALGRFLVVLALTFELAGLASIDFALREVERYGGLIASLPPGPVVVRSDSLSQSAVGLTRRRAVYCAASSGALKRWSELALSAGEREFWFVDWQPIPAAWLSPDLGAPDVVAESDVGSLHAVRYDTGSVHAALGGTGEVRESCIYRGNV
jgi:hypothetical protein